MKDYFGKNCAKIVGADLEEFGADFTVNYPFTPSKFQTLGNTIVY